MPVPLRRKQLDAETLVRVAGMLKLKVEDLEERLYAPGGPGTKYPSITVRFPGVPEGTLLVVLDDVSSKSPTIRCNCLTDGVRPASVQS